VDEALRVSLPGAAPELRIIKTEGDRFESALLSSGSSVGIFVREIEEELLAGRIDLAVHSLKDLPTVQPEGLVLAAFPAREDPRDVLVVRQGGGLADLPLGATVGTGSPRRIGQLLALRPDLRFEAIRGNVDTRIRKLRDGEVEALVLAAAGLRRLGVSGVVFHCLPTEMILPAPGQGALAIEVRANDESLVREIGARLNHVETASAVRAERAFLRSLGGGCQMPVGALGTVRGEQLFLQGVVAAPDGSTLLREKTRGPARDPESVGEELGRRVLEAGASELLDGSKRKARER
jgi:hydroxymethylbilane synthase